MSITIAVVWAMVSLVTWCLQGKLSGCVNNDGLIAAAYFSCWLRLSGLSRLWKSSFKTSSCQIRHRKWTCLTSSLIAQNFLPCHRRRRNRSATWGDWLQEVTQSALLNISSAFMFHLASLESPYLSKIIFLKKLKLFKAKLEDQLLDQYISACTVTVVGQKQIDVHQMSEHYLKRHPYTSTGPPLALKIKPKKKKPKDDQNWRLEESLLTRQELYLIVKVSESIIEYS